MSGRDSPRLRRVFCFPKCHIFPPHQRGWDTVADKVYKQKIGVVRPKKNSQALNLTGRAAEQHLPASLEMVSDLLENGSDTALRVFGATQARQVFHSFHRDVLNVKTLVERGAEDHTAILNHALRQ